MTRFVYPIPCPFPFKGEGEWLLMQGFQGRCEDLEFCQSIAQIRLDVNLEAMILPRVVTPAYSGLTGSE